MAIRFEDKGEGGKVWKTPAAPAPAVEAATEEKAQPLPHAKPVRPEKKRKRR